MIPHVALIGYGGIARVHAASYLELEKAGKAKLVAAFDRNPEAFSKSVAINNSDNTQTVPDFRFYTDLDEMLGSEQIDLVDICLPTQLHKALTVDLLNRGYHVLCEKPMATAPEDCAEMIAAAKASGKQLMIGHCLRFAPAYKFLRDAIRDRRFGAVRSAYFERLSAPPTWCAGGWNTKKENFGSCLHDLQIHDADMAQFLFGIPEHFSAEAESVGFSAIDRVISHLFYPGFRVTLAADWSLPAFSFRSSYRVAFEQATVACEGDTVTVYPKEGSPYAPQIGSESAYTREIAYFLDVIAGRCENETNPPESSAATVSLILGLSECSGAKKAPLVK